MIYVKAVVVGTVCAMFAAVLWVAANLVLPVSAAWLAARFSASGAGGAAASVGSGSTLLAALAGFAAGVWWTVRRARRRRSAIAAR
jgi:hypothetical protein